MAAISNAISESLFAAKIGISLAAILGLACVAAALAAFRKSARWHSAPPPAWYYLVCAAVSLAGPVLLWRAQVFLLSAPKSLATDATTVLARFQGLLFGTFAASLASAVLLGLLTLLPLRTKIPLRPARALIGCLAFEAALITGAVALYLQTSWLRQVALTGGS